MRIALVCSTGGHLAQVMWLKPWWERHDRFFVTFDKPDARELLGGERVYWAAHPTTRNLPNLARNTLLARRLFDEEHPDLVFSNGAGLALPFFWLAKTRGIPTIFQEVYDRIDTPSLTGRLVAPFASTVLLQWEAQKRHYPDGVVLGAIG